MASDFYIQIETPGGVIVGPGPITSASNWTHTGGLSRAGSFSFNMPASDPMALYVTEKRRVRAFALLGGVWTECGDGIIDRVDTSLADPTLLAISGPDGAGELAGYLAEGVTLSHVSTGVAQPASYAIDLLETAATAFAGTTWTITSSDITAAELYGEFYDETILQALGIIAEKSGGYFYYAGNRTIHFFTGFTSSGVRAIDAYSDLSAETCAITSCKKSVETHDLISRIYPRGGGNGNARINLRACTRTAPTGYTLNTTAGWLRKNDAYATYGTIDRKVEWKDIVPFKTNTDADLENAANALFDVAKIYLDVYSVRAVSYDLSVAGCSQRLRPGQTIRIDYHDPLAGISINENLYIIEATLAIDDNGLRTTDLIVSTQARWPLTDGEVLASQIAEGRIFRSNPQTGPNAYAIAYTKNVDDTETATFAFGFGQEVVQLQSVVFDFQLLPFESTVKSVAVESMTGGAGELATDATAGTSSVPVNNSSGTPSDNASSVPNNNASGSPSTNASGSPSTNDSGAPSNNTSSAPSTNASGTPSNNASSAPSNNASGAPSTNNSGAPSTTDTGASGTLSTGLAEGGGLDAQGRHRHTLSVTLIGSPGTPVTLVDIGGLDYLHTTGSSGSLQTSVESEHTHSITSHTHSLGSHTHTLNSHTHSLGSHTHDLNNHTHTLGSHTHDLNNHTHTLNSHTHTLGSHTHTLNNHTHDLNNHTHTLNNHTHTLNNHTHTMTPTIVTVYGIFRESALNTYAITDLECRVNASAWFELISAVSIGGGWYRLEITWMVYDPTTFRPNQERNTLQIRRKSAAAADKTVTIDAQLFIRQTIQAISYAA